MSLSTKVLMAGHPSEAAGILCQVSKLPLSSGQNICYYVSRTTKVRTSMKLCVMFMLLNFLQTTDCIRTSIFRASMKVLMVMSFLPTSFAEISSEGELFVHRRKAVMLFTNIAVDNYQKEDRVVSLYINGVNNQRLIAVWVLESNIAIKWLDDYYAKKIFMDANQNIWIYNVDENDVGLYAIKYGILTNLAGPEVKLTVLDELTEEEQVQKWLDDHPEIKKKYSSSSFSTRWESHEVITFSTVFAFFFIVFVTILQIKILQRKYRVAQVKAGESEAVLQWKHVAPVKAGKSEAVLQRAHHVAEVKAGRIEAERERENDRMLEEIERNFNRERKVKNILLVGLPAAGKSSLINSFACLILGRYIPIASEGKGVDFTHTYAVQRYPHFGITERHLRSSPNERSARRIHLHLPCLTDFIGLANENTEEISEILSLQILGHLEPGIQITGLFEHQKKLGVGSLRSLYRNSREDCKTDVVIFVHSVETREVPNELIKCLLNVIRPRNTLRPVDVDFYVVLTKMDKVERGEVTEKSVNAIEKAVADLFGIHGFKEYRLVKLTNWYKDVGFPNFTAYNQDGPDERSVTLNNQLLKLLRNISTPRAESGPRHDITFIQTIWFHLTKIIRIFYIQPFGPGDILIAALFGLLLIIVDSLLISQ